MIYFEKVEKYKNDKSINIPQRQTYDSIAYDFEAAEDTVIPSLFQQVWDNITKLEPIAIKPYLVKTGIKADFPRNTGLFIANRSGGPKKGLVLANSIGVIDSDYYCNPDNDGEIAFAFYNFSLKSLVIKKGERIGQGWFTKIQYVTNDQPVKKMRESGFNSTGD